MRSTRPVVDPPAATGPDGPICPITELATAWCGHCRYPQAGHYRMRDRLSRRSRARELDIVDTFRARWGGPCAVCDDLFPAGEVVAVTCDGGYVCRGCYG